MRWSSLFLAFYYSTRSAVNAKTTFEVGLNVFVCGEFFARHLLLSSARVQKATGWAMMKENCQTISTQTMIMSVNMLYALSMSKTFDYKSTRAHLPKEENILVFCAR